jgi:two-component system, chemotaxis family, chemotaxis protein CheY
MIMNFYLGKKKSVLTKKRILVIDSEWNMLKLLYALLSDQYELVVKESSFDAVQWLESGNRPELIITEYQLPYIDGPLLVRHLKYSGIYGQTPVIILSDAEDLKIKAGSLPLSSGAIISKPFNPSYLMFKINALINEHQSAMA